ncbi:hypothetical protein MIND_01384500 [Mycena indigotica]|uniref:Uncharacterized protein n=1 Tax=Mycena indigotica TaxID=2126181 RepID=A0A8H6VRF2_9AGAR|nr:uncharacterized protein MIND_01384500 [Mycena indigotica]KAF7289231.1 hypothetical protein MIND_01384500 [Mycena indigotica]
MSHTSPATYLVWAIVSTILLSFLIFHLWSFDRFQCLRWNTGSSGAFKRLMTYSYLTSTPLILAYSLGFTIIKYQQGFIDVKGHIIPKPVQLWPEAEQRAVFPFLLAFSIAWSLEMITHLEELCFWLFLVNSGSVQQDWFRSWYFRTWVIGSAIAITYMPLLTILTRSDVLKCEAYTFLAGSLGSLSLTLWFTPILWAFPAFLNSLKNEGVDTDTVVRLTKFHELNMIRVCFRFIMCIPLVILGVDGVRPHNHINESMLWTDILIMASAFGCGISSSLTLVIFFPRSVKSEIANKDAARDRKRIRHGGAPSQSTFLDQDYGRYSSNSYMSSQQASPEITKPSVSLTFPPSDPYRVATPPYAGGKELEDAQSLELPRLPAMRPNRRRGGDIEMGGIDRLTENNLSQHNLRQIPSGKVHPMVHNFTSPIDF